MIPLAAVCAYTCGAHGGNGKNANVYKYKKLQLGRHTHKERLFSLLFVSLPLTSSYHLHSR